ncbi:RraA family protein [Actinomadura sp. 6K520]|uniref:RraA family protein n=1 Tax=Actinomadura sp. 6K520 TaxID=2530364 RepID=UPI0010528618|nr:RraA family protein [Actinomadura sp. 6K520]TDE37694.1 RraA family protein [Actinomadura sp. 6K520]
MSNDDTSDGAADNTRDRATQAAELGCAALVDAMGRVHGHRAHILALTSPDPARPLFGPASTLAYLPYRDDLPQSETGFAELFYQALGAQPQGRVLVLSSGGYPDASLGGGTKLSRGDHQQIAGILADGRLRDFTQLRGYRFSTWCRGEATRWGGDTVMPYAADVAVEIAGVTITPGDYIYADTAGAVVIPAVSIDRVLAEAHTVEAEDTQSAEAIRTEKAEDFRP